MASSSPPPPTSSLPPEATPPRGQGRSPELLAALGGAAWVFAVIAYAFFTRESEGQGRGLIVMLVAVMPLAVIWSALVSLRASRMIRAQGAHLEASIEALHKAYLKQSQARGVESEPLMARKLDEIAAATRKTESALASFSAQRHSAPPPVEPSGGEQGPQATLALGTPALSDEPPRLSISEYIRALNFPETTEDNQGFSALRKALRDPNASQLVQAAQDTLTLLSQDGVYMDDLRPERPRPELWRRFAGGERGEAVQGLAAIQDRAAIAMAEGRMRQDPIFRDTAHHFIRRFDQALIDFEPRASDAELAAMANTRTARAFLLLGQVSGSFE